MKAVTLYFILLKATLITFAELASLPVLREDLVVKRHVLKDDQLSTAIVVTRTTPGPVGRYVVSVGYFVDGTPGAIAGWLAMVTPALIMIPLIYYAGRRAHSTFGSLHAHPATIEKHDDLSELSRCEQHIQILPRVERALPLLQRAIGHAHAGDLFTWHPWPLK